VGAVHSIKTGHCRDVRRMTALAPKDGVIGRQLVDS